MPTPRPKPSPAIRIGQPGLLQPAPRLAMIETAKPASPNPPMRPPQIAMVRRRESALLFIASHIALSAPRLSRAYAEPVGSSQR